MIIGSHVTHFQRGDLTGIVLAMRCSTYWDGKVMEYEVQWQPPSYKSIWYTNEELVCLPI